MKGYLIKSPYDKVDVPRPIQRTKDDIPNGEEYNTIKTYLGGWVTDYINGDERFVPINVISDIQTQLDMRVGEILMMKWKNGYKDVGKNIHFPTFI